MQNSTDTAQAIANSLYAANKIDNYEMTEQGTVALITTLNGNQIALSTEMWEGTEAATYTVYAGNLSDGDMITTDGFDVVDDEDQAAADFLSEIDRY